MKNGFVNFCRILVGTIFVISGLIKANDPYGTGYKLEEYFEVFSQDIGYNKIEKQPDVTEEIKASPCFSKLTFDKTYEYVEIPQEQLGGFQKFLLKTFKFFSKNSLILSMVLCILEVALGLLILFGTKIRLVSIILLLMCIFFAFLTYYSAKYNKVTDCGCFGDALKLKPWESFWKDMILIGLLLPILFFGKGITSNKITKGEWAVAIGSVLFMTFLCFYQFKWYFPIGFLGLLMFIKVVSARWNEKYIPALTTVIILGVCTSFTVYSTNHMPLKDYRPWAPGNDIRAQLKGTPEQAEVQMVYLENSTCKEVWKPTDNWDWLDSTFDATHTFYKQDKKIIKEAVEPKIKDFTLEDGNTGTRMADSLMNNKGYTILWTGYNVEKTNLKNMDRIKSIYEYASKNNILFLGGSASTSDKVDKFRHDNQILFPIYLNDEKSLKTILRSNPGLVLIKDGIVIEKWHYNDFPTLDEMKADYLK